MILLLALVSTGCGGPTTDGRTSPAADPIAALVNELEPSGAQVTPLGAFNPDPLGGSGLRLCVGGQDL